MKKNILILILCASTVFLFIKNFVSASEVKDLNEKHKIKEEEHRFFKDGLYHLSKYSGYFKFPKNYMLESIDGKNVSINDAFDKTRPVLYISSNNCNMCIYEFIKRFNRYYHKKSEIRYAVFANGFNKRELYILKQDHKIHGDVFVVNDELDFFNTMDKAMNPFYFTINSDLEISNVFFPEKSTLFPDKIYFKNIGYVLESND
jgi:hypothetical protein